MSGTAALPRRVRSVFVSDLHLGYKGADIAALNAFLKAHEFERIYLVGDILDGWKLEKRWYWNREYTEFVETLLERRRRRVRITLITGNHDEKLRDMLAILFRPVLLRKFGIRVEERIVHRARDGRQYLVMHGDQFDGALTRGSSKLADRVWSFLIEKALVRPRRSDPPAGGGGKRWSLGKEIAKNALHLANRYARRALRRASEDGMDGIVCGHSHLPVMREERGILLANCGSWTGAKEEGGMHTAVVETHEGRLEMVNWPAMRRAPSDARMQALPPESPGTRHPDATRLIRLIHTLWAPPRMADATAARAAALPGPPRAVSGETTLRQAT